MDIMGLIPGAVTPLGILNDTEKKVHFYLDKHFLEEPGLVGVHPNDNTAKFVIENTDNTENKILASGNKVVVTDVNNNILYTSNETTAQIDVEDYEENHPEKEEATEDNNTVGNNKVENPHTGDSILVYVVAGIIAVIGIATLTKKNNR